MKCRYFCRLPLDISPVYLTRGISYSSGRDDRLYPFPGSSPKGAGTDPQNRLPFSRHEGNSGKSGLQSSLPMYFPGNPKRTFP